MTHQVLKERTTVLLFIKTIVSTYCTQIHILAMIHKIMLVILCIINVTVIVDYCDFELVTETSCFLSESHTDNADWTRRTVVHYFFQKLLLKYFIHSES